METCFIIFQSYVNILLIVTGSCWSSFLLNTKASPIYSLQPESLSFLSADPEFEQINWDLEGLWLVLVNQTQNILMHRYKMHQIPTGHVSFIMFSERIHDGYAVLEVYTMCCCCCWIGYTRFIILGQKSCVKKSKESKVLSDLVNRKSTSPRLSNFKTVLFYRAMSMHYVDVDKRLIVRKCSERSDLLSVDLLLSNSKLSTNSIMSWDLILKSKTSWITFTSNMLQIVLKACLDL